jgi:glutathione synthase/RimK-type ligase-like ATP-grasp enzyme
VSDVRLVTCAELPVPDPDLAIIKTALERRSVVVDVADWRGDTDWSDTPCTLIRSPWDYIDHLDEFVAWVGRVGARTELWNPPALLTWNVHKAYLLDLQERGAPIVPTVVLLQGSAASLDGICDAQGWNTIVVKPAVGIGGIGGGRYDVGDPNGQHHLDELLTKGDALVQPFVASVADRGELSVMLFDGVVSHAIRKRPAAGEFRVHEERGGTSELVDLPPGASELAARVVEVLPAPALYARIDMLQFADGWHVLEVEATEPSLWLDHAPPAATDRYADAVMARLEARRGLR